MKSQIDNIRKLSSKIFEFSHIGLFLNIVYEIKHLINPDLPA